LRIRDLDNIAIVGVGLLGGSIGLGLRAAGYRGRILGIGHRASTMAKAVESGCVDRGFLEVPDCIDQCPLVILATPIGKFEQMLVQLSQRLREGAIVTDVGSTKRYVLRLAGRKLPPDVRFVGSHPMAGSEKRGVDFARADLFDNAVCIITPGARSDGEAVETVRQLWESLGMRVVQMSAQRHDRILSRISHLPHVVAAALVNCNRPEELKLCGPGFLDTTRVSSGDVGLWRDIIGSNKDNIVKALDLMQEQLSQLQQAVKGNDMDGLCRFLEQARKRRQNLIEYKLQERQLD